VGGGQKHVEERVLGVVLAGGRGSRLGGAKPTAELAGRPLISYPLAALAEAGLEAAVVAKPDTDLGGRPLARTDLGGRPLAREAGVKTTAPSGAGQRTTTGEGGVAVLFEPAEPVHPLTGIVAALRQTGRPIVVVGCDFPFVPPALLRALADAPEPLVVPTPGGEAQPLVARWTPALLPALDAALEREEPLRRTVAALSPRLLEDTELVPFGDPARVFFNVNTPADLRRAEGAVSSLDGH
jgi:molybdopterin-guanine dinucleotide biosynthesis protein A